MAHLHSLASARNRLVAEATPKPPGPSGRRDLPARHPGRFVPVFFVQAALHLPLGGQQRGGGDGRARDGRPELVKMKPLGALEPLWVSRGNSHYNPSTGTPSSSLIM